MPLDNVVILSSNHPANNWFIRSVHHAFPLRAVVRVVDSGTKLSKRRKGLTLNRVLQSLERRLFYKWLYAMHEHRLAEAFQAEDLPAIDVETIRILASELNTEATAALLRRLGAELLVVHSAPLLQPTIFNAPSQGAINVHYGIAPDYRGENTIFWPLYYRDYEKIGMTIHRISSGIDAGKILCQGYPKLEPRDSEHTLNLKCARLAPSLVSSLLRDWDFVGPGEPQPSRGRNFNRRDRRLFHDALYTFRRFILQEKVPCLPERRSFASSSTARLAVEVGL